jgi:hypothetical protein
MTTSWSDPTVVLTVILVILTGVYVVCTIALWRATRTAAEAAKASADAALKSAELTRIAFETVSRPYVGTSGATLLNWNDPRWTITIEWKNFGSLPAPDAVFRGQINVSGNILFDETETAMEIFPGYEFAWRKDFNRELARFEEIADGRSQLSALAEIRYSITGGQVVVHHSEYVYRFHLQRFEHISASTRPLQ